MIRIETLAWKYWLTVLILLGAISPTTAQPIIEASDGTGTVVKSIDNRFDISGGSLSGDKANLFHSFSQFGLSEGQIANFLSNPNIRNILGRINGGDPSIINGLIQVTGGNSNLFLMNPAGIIFGPGASLNVPASFTATTATGIGFGNQWFNAIGANNWEGLVGTPHQFIFSNLQPGAIFNAGNLTVKAGESLSLIGGTVVNIGQLSAPKGNILISAVPGERLIRIHQEGSLLSLDVQSVGNPQNWTQSVLSLPQLLTGKGVDNAAGVTVNGNGEITLTGQTIATAVGDAIASGNLNVSGEIGGQIVVLGSRVGLLGATLNASGTQGGGTILVGGDYQGLGTIPNASNTFVSQNSTLNVDSVLNGNGGRVIVWADETTRFYGNISARGGANGGNGGFAEVSGKTYLEYQGFADLRSPLGTLGTLLLDPTDITISSGTDTGGNFGGGIFAPSAGTSIINNDTLQTQLNAGNVTISTESAFSSLGNITVDAAVTWNNSNSLKLQANNNINVNAPITNSGNGAIELQANNGISVNANLTTQGGNILLTSNNDINTTAATLVANSSLGNAGAISLSTTGGNINTGNLYAITTVGNGGNITLSVAGGTGSINTSAGFLKSDAVAGTGNAGEISLTTSSGNIITGNISSRSSNTNTGLSGNITLSVTGGTGFINTSAGQLYANSATGNSGDVSLSTVAGNIITDGIYTLGYNANGGDIFLSTAGGNITTNNLNSSSWGTGTGVSGNITLSITGGTGSIHTNSFYSGSTTGKGGDISLSTVGGNITTAYLQSTQSSHAGGSGGNITLSITGGTGSIDTSVGDLDSYSLIGNAGVISLSTSGGNIITRGLFADASSGNGGSISVTAGSGIQVGSIKTSTTSASNLHTAGTINLNAGTGNIVLTGNIDASSVNGSGSNLNVPNSVILTQPTTTISTLGPVSSGSVTFNSTLDGTTAGSQSLIVNAGPSDITFKGALGGTTALGNITANSLGVTTFNSVNATNLAIDAGGPIQLNGNVTTVGSQTYSDAVTIANNPILTGDGITFNSTVDGSSDLTVNAGTGNVTFASAIGSTTPLANLVTKSTATTTFNNVTTSSLTTDVSGTTQLNGNVTTTGNQTYSNVVTLANHPILAGNGITFNNTVDGNSNLTLNSSIGNIIFAGVVGGTNPLGTLAVNNSGTTTFNTVNVTHLTIDSQGSIHLTGNVTTSGNQIYPTAVTIANNPILTGNGITFNSTVDGNSDLTVNAGNGNIIFAGGVGTTVLLGNLTTNTTGATTFNTVNVTNLSLAPNSPLYLNGNVTTIGSQTYPTAVTIANNPILTGNGVTFNSTVDGNSDLTVNAGAGNLIFSSAVGSITPLGNLTTSSTGTTTLNNVTASSLTTHAGGTTQLNGTVTTTGLQSYLNAVTIANNPVLNGNGITFNSTLDGNSNLTVNSGSGNLTFAGTVGATTPLVNLTANSTGTTSFQAVNTTNLAIDPGGSIQLNGNITTAGNQIYPDAVTIANNPVLKGNDITFNATVDGNSNLTLNSGSGNVTFNAAVGSLTPLRDLTVSNANNVLTASTINVANLTQALGTGTTTFNGTVNTNGAGGINLTGTNFNINGAVVTANGGSFVINNSGDFQLPTTASLQLDGSFNQNGTGAVTVGANIATNNRDIQFSSPVTLTAPVILSPGNAAIAFGSSLNAGNYPLTLTASEIDFGGPVSGSSTLVLQPAYPGQNIILGDSNNSTSSLDLTLSDLTALQPGLTALTLGRLDSQGNVTLASPLTFNNSVTIQTGSGAIDLNHLLTGNDNASIDLKASTINLNAGINTNNGNIAIAGNLNLGTDVTLNSPVNINVTGGINGPHSLTLTGGNLYLQGNIGETSPLARLQVNTSTTHLGGNITSSGDLNLNSVVLLLKDARLTTQSGNITFGSTLDSFSGNTNLNLATSSGEIQFSGAVGGKSPLGNLVVENAGNVTATSTLNAIALQSNSLGTVKLQGNVIANTVNITTGGELTVGPMAVNGGPLTLTTNSGNLTTGDLDTSSPSSQGGAIVLNSPAGIITTGNLTSSGLSGGNISVMALTSITTGRINSRGSNGSGGNVFLDPIGDIQVEWIDTQGGPSGNGGSVDIITGNFFRAVGTFTDQQGITTSISTVGGMGGGPISIRHAGGNGGPPIQPFIVGDAGINGTAGAITSGQFTLQGQSFPDSFTLGNIGIVTDNAVPVPSPDPALPTTPGETPIAPTDPVLPATPGETPIAPTDPVLPATPGETPIAPTLPVLPTTLGETPIAPTLPVLPATPSETSVVPTTPVLPATPGETPTPFLETDFPLQLPLVAPSSPTIGNPIQIPPLGPIPPIEEVTTVVNPAVAPETFGPFQLTQVSKPEEITTLSINRDLTSAAIETVERLSSVLSTNPVNLTNNPLFSPSASMSETASLSDSSTPDLSNFQLKSMSSLDTPEMLGSNANVLIEVDKSITRHWPIDRQPMANDRGRQVSSPPKLSLSPNPDRSDGEASLIDNSPTNLDLSKPSSSDSVQYSKTVLGYSGNTDTLLEGKTVEESVWQIEQLRNQEFEQYLGVSANWSADPKIAISGIQDTLQKIETETKKRSAIIYILSRLNHVELILVSASNPPIRHIVPEANRAALEPIIYQFNLELTDPRKRHSKKYKVSAQQLYQWLIAPLEPDLQKLGIETLLLSLDPGLRSLPIAALYDGKQFFIEKYSFSLVPSFSLTDTRYASIKNSTILAMGASKFQDKNPLPAVPIELQSIASEWESKLFLNADFTLENFAKQRSQNEFRIVHLATHAEFASGNPSHSYIQFWNEKLQLDRIPSINWTDPLVELLVLSACKTALGDREAELGFAGLAIQSGVRSALASLWRVDDVATMGLMSEFYEQLREVQTKGEALRKAQIAMLSGKIQLIDGQLISSRDRFPLPRNLWSKDAEDYTHPYYWSAFTLIGNPW